MQYLIGNFATNTTAAAVKVATSTSLKTMLQVKGIIPFKVVEWGWSGDASAAATPGVVELIETGTVAATSLTAIATADITRYDGDAVAFGDPVSTVITVGTGATGFNTSGGAEGSITAVRNLAGPQQIASTNQFVQQFPLGYRPFVPATAYLRIRNIFGTSVNALCYVIIEF